MTDKKKTILEAVEKLTDTYRKEELFLGKDRERLPNKKEIINFIKDMRSIIFPGYFSVDSSASVFPDLCGTMVRGIPVMMMDDLEEFVEQEQIEIAFLYQGEEEQKAKEHAEQITERFFANVPEIQRMLLTDLQAGFDGDPAAKSKEEIIFSYPGLGILAVGAVKARDYPLIQGFVLWIALIYMVVNLLVDISYHYIDPRTREGENG